MRRIGILGDIGSGKSYIANSFGYPVFNADEEVAKVYKKDKKVFHSLGTKDRKEAEEKKLILDEKYYSTGYELKWPFQLNFFSFLKILAFGFFVIFGMQFFKKPKIQIDEKKVDTLILQEEVQSL